MGSVMNVSGRTDVSIVIACYNAAPYLAEAIYSAMDQSVPPREIIIINDGSTDESLSIAKSFPTVDIISQENSGVSIARNAGISASTGSYIVFLDADDRLLPNAIRDGKSALDENHRRWMVYGGNEIIDESGDIIGINDQPEGHVLTPYEIFTGSNPVPSQSMVRRSALDISGMFKPGLAFMEDQELWLRLHISGGILYCHGHRVASYRKHSLQTTMSTAQNYKIRRSITPHFRNITNGFISNDEWRSIDKYVKRNVGEYVPFEIFRQIKSIRIRDAVNSLGIYIRTIPHSLVGSSDMTWRRIIGTLRKW